MKLRKKLDNNQYVNELPSQKYLAECFSYCLETGELRWKKRPAGHFGSSHSAKTRNVNRIGKIAGRDNGSGYLKVGIDGKRFRVHRLIWKLVHGTEPRIIDHINHNRSDNRIENLRDVSHAENMQNRAPTDHDDGVCLWFDKRVKLWKVRSTISGITRIIARSDSYEKAAQVAANAEKDYRARTAEIEFI